MINKEKKPSYSFKNVKTDSSLDFLILGVSEYNKWIPKKTRNILENPSWVCLMSETNNLPIDYPEPSEDRDFLDQLIHEQEMLKHVYDLNVELMSPPKSLVN